MTTNTRGCGTVGNSSKFKAFCLAAALATACLLLQPAPRALAQELPSKADQACLGCHGYAGMEKKLQDGDTLKLHVPSEPYVKSVHGQNGCTSCHSDVDPAAHPPEKKDIASARSFAVESAKLCGACHADKFEQYESSIHAALVRNGNPAAPICSDCHSPHAVVKDAATKLDQVPCKNCHSEIFNAYLGSMHAKSRRTSDQSFAPICSGCHTAHAVKPAVAAAASEGPTASCSGCHAGVLEAHQKWLPNAGLHFEVVSCAACHVPNAQRRVDLMLIDSAGKARGTEQVGVPLFEASARADGKGIDAAGLWNLLQTLNRSGIAGKTVVRGRLDVLNGPQAHLLADKSKAISDCHLCHQQGAQAFQKVTISLVGPDGRRVGYGASSDVLNSPFSIDAVRGFYAIGGTRIWILDVLLVLAIVGGVGVAVGHLFLGWFFKRFGFYHPLNGGHANPSAGGDGTKAT